MTASSLQDLISRYVDAWNEPGSAQRQAALASIYADDGRIVMRTGVFAGIGAIVEHIAEVFDQFIAPGRYRFASGGTVAHHDCVLFRWELRDAASGELADAGMNHFLVSAEGRITEDYQFTLGVDSSIGSSGLILTSATPSSGDMRFER